MHMGKRMTKKPRVLNSKSIIETYKSIKLNDSDSEGKALRNDLEKGRIQR